MTAETHGDTLWRQYVADYGDEEQFQAPTTIFATGRRSSETGKPIARFARTVAGKPRLRTPDTNKPVLMNGDVAAFKCSKKEAPVFAMRYKQQWIPLPSIRQIERWVIDSIVETPDGDRVEPDAPDSWLSLLALI